MLFSLRYLLLFLPLASTFVATKLVALKAHSIGARKLLALPSDVALQIPVVSMKPSIRTFLHFFLIGEMTEWRAESGEDKNILVGTKGGWVDLQLDDSAEPLEVRVVRKGGADDPIYLQREVELLQALLDEIEGIAENAEVAPEKRLIVVRSEELEAARQQLAAGPAESSDSSEGSKQYSKALEILEKKAKFEKMSEAMEKIKKGFLK